jgi:amidase
MLTTLFFLVSSSYLAVRRYRMIVCLGFALTPVLAACSKNQTHSYAVEEVSLSQIHADLATGKTTSVALTQAYIDRIETYNRELNAVIRTAPDAMDQAKASDARRDAGRARSNLDGVPILVKDNMDAMGMPTTAGSFALAENYPTQDSEVVRRLRDAGAVILGKANLDQFASYRAKLTFSGSTVGGTPHNPYALDHSASGSSNGSGIAAATSLAAATVGSDTTGSVTSPASYMGLVGMRPTVALISRRGIVPISFSQDTAGPMARNVTDLAMLLTVIAGSDPADPASKESDAHKVDYLKGLSRDALRGARLGVVRSVRGYDDQTANVFNAALAVMKQQGATLVEIAPQEFEDLFPEQLALMRYEFTEDLEGYLAHTPPTVKVRTLSDLIAFSKHDPRESMHDTQMLEEALASDGRANPNYRRTLEYARRRAGPEGLGHAMTENHLAALVLLTDPPAEKLVPDGSDSAWYVANAPKGSSPMEGSGMAALAGYPDLTVPMGAVGGLPVGLSFIGPMWSEQTLLSLGYAYEQASHARIPPSDYKTAK